MTRILHLGAKELDLNRTVNVTDTESNKPDFNSGCLWGSTLRTYNNGCVGSDWKDWTYCEEFKDYDYGVSFELKPDAKILEISSLEDYKKILVNYGHYSIFNRFKPKIELDMVKISREYDAFHLTEEAFRSMRLFYRFDLSFESFYWYDAESWIVFNYKAIDESSIQYHDNVGVDSDE